MNLAYKANSFHIQLNLSSQFYLQFHDFIGFCFCKLKRNVIIIYEDQHTFCTDMENIGPGFTRKWWDRLSVLIGRTGTIYRHSWEVSNKYVKYLHLWTRWLYHTVAGRPDLEESQSLPLSCLTSHYKPQSKCRNWNLIWF